MGSTPIHLRHLFARDDATCALSDEPDSATIGGVDMNDPLEDPRRHLAAVSVVLEDERVKAMMTDSSRSVVVDAVREVLDAYRVALAPGQSAPSLDQIVAAVAARLAEDEFERLRPVINGTGILLHTGLGRAVLPKKAVEALAGLDRCCNLQIDLETGLRGKRNYMTERLLCRLTGAEAAMIVNNNAAATMLILAALCKGKEVIVSRGQLIEIGGSYRLPDCVHQSGAILVEVGTTNKTHLRDYENAVTGNTGALMHVNPSNYRIVGFTGSVPTQELVSLRDRLKQDTPEREIVVIDDLGCGALLDLTPYGLPHEPTVLDSMAAGADLVCFSGDKLIGGPQAGIIVGRKDLIARIKKHPLTRMLRVDKMTDMALEHTLRLFLNPETLCLENPTLRMLTTPIDELKRRAAAIKHRAEKNGASMQIELRPVDSAMGGGSLPGVSIPSHGIAVSSQRLSAAQISAALRHNEPPIIARIAEDVVLIDVRTLLPGEDEAVASALAALR